MHYVIKKTYISVNNTTMRKLLTIAFVALFTFCYAQNPTLFENEWFLDHMEIAGVDYPAPTSGPLSDIQFNVQWDSDSQPSFYAWTLACKQRTGYASFPSDTQLTFSSSWGWIGTACSAPEDAAFETAYTAFFPVPSVTFEYQIVPNGPENWMLIMVNPAGNKLYFKSTALPPDIYLLLTNDWRLHHLNANGVDIYPTATFETYGVHLDFTQEPNDTTLMTGACQGGIGQLTFNNDGSFSLGPVAWLQPGCMNPNDYSFNGAYEWTFNPVGIYYYTLTDMSPLCGCPTAVYELAITSPNGNVAYYNSQTLSTTDFTKPAVSVSPNPAADFVDLHLSSAQQGQLTVSDMTGRVVRSQSVTANERLDISDLSTGLYLFTVKTSTGSATQKVIIR